MSAHKVELHHHDAEQIKGYVAEAREVLNHLGYDPDTSEALFLKVIDLLASKTVQYQVPQPVMLGGGMMPPGLPR